MQRICIFVVLSLCVAYGDESCDRKEMEDTICSLCSQRKSIQSGHQIAFFSYMSKNIPINTISKHKTLVYDRVETNAGKGYDARSGQFTAPESGLYVFHTSTTALDKSHSTIEVVKNGQVKDISWADAMDHNDRAVASTMTILSLTKGDIVSVRVGITYGGNLLESNQYTRMSFSGFKLS
ncbi:complement C1q-like protein 4 [Magallana gigas]|uniref:C1q domain-containing protein n=1 Tax=Magallana gigas TaxID=29159 RepID=A0A8W8NKI2_MAGGI|nr:heavy metal-binding protein HIP-like [Crassostrea gigas]